MKQAIAAKSIAAARGHLDFVMKQSGAKSTSEVIYVLSDDPNVVMHLRGYDKDGLQVWICSTFYDGMFYREAEDQIKICGCSSRHLE